MSFKIVRPAAITDAVLQSSNVAETDYTAYDATKIYAAGDFIRYVAANVHKVYQSTVGSRAAVTISIAAPGVVTWNAHGLVDGTPIQFTTTGALPTGITAGTTYYVKSPTTNSFNLATTVGGAAITTSGSQSGTHTATAGNNLGQTPPNATYWLDAGATNRWKMFDNANTSQTSNTSSIDVTLQTSGRVDSVALLNISAATARVKMTDATAGVVYDKTYSLLTTSGIADYYSYCFEPIDRVTDLVVTDLPPYANGQIEVILTDSGNTVLCGSCVIGLSRTIGGTQWSPKVGIQDYSIKQKDAFGNYTILQRAFNKRGSFTINVDANFVDRLQAILAQYRATPVVYIGASSYASTIIYGFYKDFSVEIAYPTKSICTLELEGLT